MIRAELLLRQLRACELAAAIGCGLPATRAAIGGQNPSPRTRRKIENYLRQPFWSSPADFKERLPLVDYFGADVEVLPMAELRKLCLKFGLLGRRSTNLPRGFFLDKLMIHFHERKQDLPKTTESQTK